MVEMRLVHVSVASALGSGPTSSVKVRFFPTGCVRTPHSASAPVHSFEQLQLHFPPSLVSIVIESTPVNHAPRWGTPLATRRTVHVARTCGRCGGRSPGVAHHRRAGRGCRHRPHSPHEPLALTCFVGGEDDGHRASARLDRLRWIRWVASNTAELCEEQR